MPQYNARPIAKKFEGQAKTFDDSRLWRQLVLGNNTGTAFAQIDSVANTVKITGIIHPQFLLSGNQSTVIIPKQADWGFAASSTQITYLDDTASNGNGGPDYITLSGDGNGNLIASNNRFDSGHASTSTIFIFTNSIAAASHNLSTIFNDLNPITFPINLG